MKKIISIVLCAMMLLGVASVSAFAADVPDDATALGDFGQKHFYAGPEVESAPTIDGVVEDGEYTLEILNMRPEDDAIDDRFFVIDICDVEFVNIYAAQDFDFLYFAVEVKDPSFVHHDAVSFSLGVHENIDSSLMFATRFNDIPDDTNMTINLEELSKTAEDPGNPYAAGDIVDRTGETYDFIGAKGLSYNEETQVATYEIAVSRMMLETEADDLLEKIFLRVVISMRNEAGELGTIWFGFRGDGADLRAKHHSYISRFPHVLYLIDGEGDEDYVVKEVEKDNTMWPQIDFTEKVSTAPVVDGVIGESEYTHTYSSDLTESADGWAFIDENNMMRAADAAYAKGLRSVSWSLARDNDFLYIATSIKTTGAAPIAQFQITKRQDTASYPMANITADGSADEGNAVWDFAEAKASNDGTTYVYEAKIALDDIGDNLDKVFVLGRAYLDEGFVLFGLNEDPLGGVCGFRAGFNGLQTTPPETEPAETEPAETEPTETEPAETTPTESAPADTTTPDAPVAEGGCGASVAAVAAALVAMLGTCVAFVNKRR